MKYINSQSDNTQHIRLSVKCVVDSTSIVKTDQRLCFTLHDRDARHLVLESPMFSGQGVTVRVGFTVLFGALVSGTLQFPW